MSRLLREDGTDDDDREKAYDDAPPRRFKFMLHHLRRRRIFVGIAVVLIIAIVIVAAVPKVKHHATAPKYTYSDYRLPSWVVPLNYNLNINTVFNQAAFNQSTFTGSVAITINITDTSKNYIVIHAMALEFSAKDVTLKSTTGSNAKTATNVESTNSDLQYSLIYFDQISKIGKSPFVLTINFKGNLTNNTMSGYYLSTYTSGGQYFPVATTQFEPTYARRAFPCFDEPGMKATFDISMTVDKDYQVISNMPAKSQNGQTTTFETSPLMSTYLLCYIVHKFKSNSQTVTVTDGTVKVSIFTTPDTIDQTEYALNTTINALLELNNYFGVQYPLPKLDVVAIPDFSAGAMENWGLITFRQNALLFDTKTGSAMERQRVADVIVHELAHQWFGNLVTMKWWSDIFLNEGFATYMEYVIVPKIEPSWNFPAQFQIDVHQSAFKIDSLLGTHPITNNFSSPREIASGFDAITYDKGASVLKMLNSYVDSTYGAGTFQQTIQKYIAKYKYSNAAAADLWATFDKPEIAPLMTSWVTQAGFPYLNVSDSNSSVATITQSRYLQLAQNSSSTQTWQVFVDAVDSKMKNHSCQVDSGTIKCPYDWTTNGYMLLNADGSGFYRTYYNVTSANQITDLSKLTNVQRSVVYDDVFNFWLSGKTKSAEVIKLTKNLQTETDYVVWVTALSGFNEGLRLLRLAPCRGYYEAYVRSLLTPIVATMKWDAPEANDTNHNGDLFTSLILLNGFNYDVPEVAQKAAAAWNDFINNNISLNANIRNTVLRYAIATGNETTMSQVIKMYQDSTVSAVRVSCLQALGYARKNYLQKIAIDFALSDQVRSQDAYIVFVYMASNRYGFCYLWDFLTHHFDVFDEGKRLEDFRDDVAKAVAPSMGIDSLDDMEQFLTKHNLQDTLAGKQALEIIRINGQMDERDVCVQLNAPVL